MTGASAPFARIRVPRALEPAGLVELGRALAAAGRDESARVLLLEGADGVFCRGLDAAVALEARSVADEARAAQAFASCLRAVRFAGKPTIAAVDGEALGGGVGLAAACDLVLATERATFALPELLFGLLPATILPLLHERMPPQKARLLALRGRSHSAAEAQALGLVDEIAPLGGLERAIVTAARLLARARPGAVGALKRHADQVARLEVAEAIERGAALTADTLRDEAVVGALRAFLEDGTAPWLAE